LLHIALVVVVVVVIVVALAVAIAHVAHACSKASFFMLLLQLACFTRTFYNMWYLLFQEPETCQNKIYVFFFPELQFL